MLEVVRLKTLSGNLVWLNVMAVAQVMRVPAGPCGECQGGGRRLAPLGPEDLLQLAQAGGVAQGISLVNGVMVKEAKCEHCGGAGRVGEAWGVVMLGGIVHPVEKRYAARVVRALRKLGQLPGDEWKRGKR